MVLGVYGTRRNLQNYFEIDPYTFHAQYLRLQSETHLTMQDMMEEKEQRTSRTLLAWHPQLSSGNFGGDCCDVERLLAILTRRSGLRPSPRQVLGNEYMPQLSFWRRL